jgi:hypothetical protein
MFTLLTTQGGESYLPNVNRMPYLDQGTTNGCGTTSLAMAMTYLGVPKTRTEIDSSIRRMDVLSAPGDLMEYARTNGLKTWSFNRGRFEDLVKQIDAGNPCICLINANYQYPAPKSSRIHGFHYVVVSGYRLDKQRDASLVVFHDPNAGDDTSGPGFDVEATLADFRSVWDDVGWGFRRYYISIAVSGSSIFEKEEWPRHLTGAEGTVGTLKGVADLCNGLDRIATFSPKSFLRGVGQVGAGLTQIVGCGISGLIQLAGTSLNDAVDGIPVVQNLVKPLGDSWNAGAAVASDVTQVFANTQDAGGQILGNLASGDVAGAGEVAGNAALDVVGGSLEAVYDAGEGIVDAVTHLFDW